MLFGNSSPTTKQHKITITLTVTDRHRVMKDIAPIHVHLLLALGDSYYSGPRDTLVLMALYRRERSIGRNQEDDAARVVYV